MTQTLATLFRRDDTFFGVCQAVGDDFGFNPNWLRVGLALPIIFAPMLSVAIYAALAVAVIVSRLLVPAVPRDAKVAPPLALPTPADVANDTVELAQAA